MTDCNPTILKAELQSLSVINERLNCEIGNLKIELESLRQENSGLKKSYEVMMELATNKIHELVASRQENSRLREALQLLYDNQNGPPLLKYEKQWTEAMNLASEVLTR